MKPIQPVLYIYNNHYITYPQEYRYIENKISYPISYTIPPQITFYPKSNNLVINLIKKEQNQKIVFNSMRDIRLPQNYKDLSYDSPYNK